MIIAVTCSLGRWQAALRYGAHRRANEGLSAVATSVHRVMRQWVGAINVVVRCGRGLVRALALPQGGSRPRRPGRHLAATKATQETAGTATRVLPGFLAAFAHGSATNLASPQARAILAIATDPYRRRETVPSLHRHRAAPRAGYWESYQRDGIHSRAGLATSGLGSSDGEKFPFSGSSRADTARTRRRCIRPALASAPRARRAAGARREGPNADLSWLRSGVNGADCSEPLPSVKPANASRSARPLSVILSV
jgi:hypothetical protein